MGKLTRCQQSTPKWRSAASWALVLALITPLTGWADSGDEEKQDDALQLTLSDAVRLAFENNLDIRVVDYDRDTARESIRSQEGAFDPVFQLGTPGAQAVQARPSGPAFGGTLGGVGGFGFAGSQSPTTSQLQGADVVEQDTFSTVLNMFQTLPFGFQYNASYTVNRNETNSVFNSLNPAWDNTLSVQVGQPLLRGRGKEATAAQLLLAQRNRQVAEEAFRTQVEKILLRVEQSYWELVFAERSLDVSEQSLSLALEQLERTQAQVEVGMLAPVQETQAQAAVAARRSELIVARNTVDNAADQLRGLLRADSLPGGWDTELVATEEPAAMPEEVELAQALETARERRPELAGNRAQIAARRVELDAARNQTLPQLDLLASLNFTGNGGDFIIRDGFFGDIIAVIPGGYGDAVGEMFSLDFPTWRVGFNFSYTLGNNTAEANYAAATVAEDKARAELQRTDQQVVLEVRQAVRELAAVAEKVQADRVARELAQRQLEIEQDRFEVGMTTNFEVLTFQDDLAVARRIEIRSIINYMLAQAQLARATGTLLERAGITINPVRPPD